MSNETLPLSTPIANVGGGGTGLPDATASGTVPVWNGTEWVADTAPAVSKNEDITLSNTSSTLSTVIPNSSLTSNLSTGWLSRVTSWCQDRNGTVTNCSDGFIVTAGIYTNTTFYNADGTAFPTQITTGTGHLTTAIAKYNKQGVVQWVARCYDTLLIYSNVVVCDSDNNIYISFFRGGLLSVFNSDGTQYPTTIAGAGVFDIGLVSYDSNGMVRWLTKINGIGEEYNGPNSIYDGYLYVSGESTSNPVTAYNADGTAFGTTLTNAGSSDIIFVKYSLDGVVKWIARAASAGIESGANISTGKYGMHACIPFGGNTLTVYNSDASAFPETLTNNQFNSNEWWADTALGVTQYNHDGNVQWLAKIGALSPQGGGITSVTTKGKTALFNNELYVAVNFSGRDNIVYNAGGTYAARLKATGSNNIAIVKYSQFGQCLFAYTIGNMTLYPNSYLNIANIKVNQFGIFVCGGFSSDVLDLYNFDGSLYQSYNKTAGATSNIYAAMYNHKGNIQWATVINGAGNNYPFEMEVDGPDVLLNCQYATTPINVTLPYGENTLTTTKTNPNDTLIVKYSIAKNAVLPDPVLVDATTTIQKVISLDSTVLGSCARITCTTPITLNNVLYRTVYLQNKGSNVTLTWNGANWVFNSGTEVTLADEQ